MFCSNCGRQIGNSSKFCPYCGSSTDMIEEDLAASSNAVRTNPAPTLQEEFAPVMREEYTPVMREEPVPVMREEPVPVMREEPVPVMREEPAPVMREEYTPVMREEPAPVMQGVPAPVMLETTAPTEKFCGRCGAVLSDGMTFCGNCGAPAKDVPNSKAIRRPKPARKKSYKWIIALVASVVILIVAAVAAFVAIQFTGFNGLTKTVMSAYVDYDVDKLMDVASDAYDNIPEQSVESHFKSILGYGLDQIELLAGRDVRLSYQINNIYDMSKRQMEKKLQEMSSSFRGYDMDAITQIVVADVTLIGKSKDDEAEVDLSLIMCRENGACRLLDIENSMDW